MKSRYKFKQQASHRLSGTKKMRRVFAKSKNITKWEMFCKQVFKNYMRDIRLTAWRNSQFATPA